MTPPMININIIIIIRSGLIILIPITTVAEVAPRDDEIILKESILSKVLMVLIWDPLVLMDIPEGMEVTCKSTLDTHRVTVVATGTKNGPVLVDTTIAREIHTDTALFLDIMDGKDTLGHTDIMNSL